MAAFGQNFTAPYPVPAEQPTPSRAGSPPLPRGPVAAVSNMNGKGRGVVALVDLAPDASIERCPVLIIPDHDRAKVDPTIIFTYVFMWEHGTAEEDLYAGFGRAASRSACPPS